MTELLTRSAPYAPSSYDPEARTIVATIASRADVTRVDSRGLFIERLDTAAIDPASLVGTAVLDGHRRDGSKYVVGSIIEAWREADDLVAKMRLSAAEDVRSVVLKVAEGILRACSVGYVVTRWSESTEPPKTRVRTATAWRIDEVSIVGVPADARSKIRSETMTTPNVAEQEAPQIETPLAPQGHTRAAENAQIRSMAEVAGLDRAWADAQIDSNATVDAARAAAFTAMQERGAAGLRIRPQVGTDHSDPVVIMERQAEALAQRMGGPAASEAATPFVEYGFRDHAREILRRSGVSTDRMTDEGLLTRAMMTTSDFPKLLEDSGNRVVLTAYQAAQSPLIALANRRLVSDLRDVTVLKLGEGSQLEEITESGEFKHGSFGENAETYRMSTFGKKFNLSRKLILNDQFGVFGDMVRALGQLAAAYEADALIGLLTSGNGGGPVMSDGKQLFHADHGNLAATGTGLTTASLTAARLAMRTQKGLDGRTPVGVTPRYLVVGPELETEAEQILATLAATKVEDQNVFAGRLQLVVEPRIADASWYIFGDKATAPVLEMAYLAGSPGPKIEPVESRETLGRGYRVYQDLGVGAVDHRGVYRNPGEA